MKYFSRIHPLLFLVASFTYSYLFSIIIAPPFEIFRPFLISLVFFIIIIYPIYFLTSDWDWSAVLLSIVVTGFLSPASFFAISGMFGLVGLVLFFLYYRFRKIQFTKKYLGLVLSWTGICLIALNLFLFNSQSAGVPVSYIKSLTERKGVRLQVLSGQTAPPDIYYIVLDAYGRQDILNEYYGFDNAYFLGELSERGFILPEKSTSNYPKTVLSIASTLNMNYLDEIAPDLEDFRYWWLMKPLIDQSQVRLSLEGIGYQTVSVATDWGITNNQTTDFYLHPGQIVLNDFEGYLLGTTSMKYLENYLSRYAVVPSYSGHRTQIKYNFTALKEIPKIPGPKFVFVHIIAPHPPFVFDENGNPINPQTYFSFADANDFALSKTVYRNHYVNQLKYINSELLKTIDEVISTSSNPPIIILQADHGPGMYTDFDSSENSCLRERFSTFAAYYLPGLDSQAIPEDITPVNLFRTIFNEYFEAQLPLLENAHFFSTDPVRVYALEDVTARVDDVCQVK